MIWKHRRIDGQPRYEAEIMVNLQDVRFSILPVRCGLWAVWKQVRYDCEECLGESATVTKAKALAEAWLRVRE